MCAYTRHIIPELSNTNLSAFIHARVVYFGLEGELCNRHELPCATVTTRPHLRRLERVFHREADLKVENTSVVVAIILGARISADIRKISINNGLRRAREKDIQLL